MKELQGKIDEIDNVSDSQKDRFESQRLVQRELISFIQNQIVKINSKNELRNSVVKILKDRIEDEEDPISNSQLLKLFEVLSKDENDAISNILGVVKDKQSTIINIPGENGSSSKDGELSSDEVASAKKLLNVLDVIGKLQKSEMSLDELEE